MVIYMKQDARTNQAMFSHGLYFDPINQYNIPDSDGRLRFDPFQNVPGVCVLDDGSVEVTYYAPGAKTVQIVGLGGSFDGSYDLAPMDQPGYWKAVLSDVLPGFHYHWYLVDGVQTLHPQVPVGYGCSRAINYFEVPDPEFDAYLLRDVPHGTIHMELYHSSVTGRYRNCWVYTPPSYDPGSENRYPVLYLQHGGGENETGWIWQGKLNYLMDNLLAEGKCREMMVVMNCGYNFIGHEGGDFTLEKIGDVIAKDCVPMIDQRYRTIKNRDGRAMAGLSFGSYHAKTTVLEHLDLFSNLGLFSGGFDYKGGGIFGKPYDYSEVFRDAEHFNQKLHLLFVGAGEQEQPMCGNARRDVQQLIEQGYQLSFFSCPGYHEWDVWRKCAFAMLQQLFDYL